jgi:integrase
MSESLAKRMLPKSVADGVYRTIDPFLRIRANGKGVCSSKTRTERRQFYLRIVAELWQLGMRIRRLESLAEKHVEALMAHWRANGIGVGTLHTRLSMISVLCNYLGKRGVTKPIDQYFPSEDMQRRTVATESKAWKAKSVDPLEMIRLATQVDERLGVMLALQHTFGLRVKESIELRPAHALIEGGRTLEVTQGTKGGKTRTVPVDTPLKAEVIQWAIRVANQGNPKRVRWPDRTWKQAQQRFYGLVRNRLGISRKALGVTPHGLRHGWSQDEYKAQTGLVTPVEGGALGKIDRPTHQMASMTVSRWLGHGRIDVTTSYCGSYGHALRPTGPVTMTYKGLSPTLPA